MCRPECFFSLHFHQILGSLSVDNNHTSLVHILLVIIIAYELPAGNEGLLTETISFFFNMALFPGFLFPSIFPTGPTRGSRVPLRRNCQIQSGVCCPLNEMDLKSN